MGGTRGVRMENRMPEEVEWGPPGVDAEDAAAIQKALNDAYAKFQGVTEGKNADYIPALAKVDSKLFGIALVTTDGKIYAVGDADSLFSIQSISKPFAYAAALDRFGREETLTRVGVEPTGDAFNAIVLDEENRRPFNPMRLYALLNGRWDGVIRSKGFFWLASRMNLAGSVAVRPATHRACSSFGARSSSTRACC